MAVRFHLLGVVEVQVGDEVVGRSEAHTKAGAELNASTGYPFDTSNVGESLPITGLSTECWVQEVLHATVPEPHGKVQANFSQPNNANKVSKKKSTNNEKCSDGTEETEDIKKDEEGVNVLINGDINELIDSRAIDIDTCTPRTLVKLLKFCAQKQDLHQGIRIHTSISNRYDLQNNNFIGSSLVNMYAKCGQLGKAQEAFDGLPIQDIVAWNALIAGYVQNKHDKEALTCFEQMQNEGVVPDNITFSCVLKACGSLKALDRGSYIHAQVVKQGLLEQYMSIGNALVDMYIKCGLLGKAQDVFDELPTLDVISWTALIIGYAVNGQGEEALRVYGRMQEAGYLPNAVTFLGALKACGSLKSALDGQEVHAAIVDDGFLEKDVVVGTALVDMYSKCGMMSEAKDVFDELSVQDSTLWSTLIEGYVQNMQSHEALKCFEQMQSAGCQPDEVTVASVIKACGDLEALGVGQQLHYQMAKDKLRRIDPIVSNALIGMYSKCGLFEKAQEVLNEMQDPDVISWNALISGYVAHGHCKEAIKCFLKMEDKGVCPDTVTFISVLKACGNVGEIDTGQSLHCTILREGLLEKEAAVGNALVYMYVKCGLLEKAKNVFHQLQIRDSVSWNLLIAGHAQGMHGDEALSYFEQMQIEGFNVDEVTFACALKACGSSRAIDKGLEIHNQMLREGLLEKSLLASNSIIDMYAKCGLLDKAQEVFEKLAIRDLVSWNSLIAGYSQHGLGEQALKCFEQMRMAGFIPDTITLVCVLKACGNVRAVEQGKEVHAEIEKLNLLETNVHIGTALVDMYAKCGLLEEAQKTFEKLSVRDAISWNALITGYVNQSLADEVLDCFEQMQAEGIAPDGISFVCALKACGILGAICKSYKLHSEITKRGLLAKNSPVGNATIDTYANCGLILEAEKIFDGLPARDAVSWNSLIAGYALIGQDVRTFSTMHEMLKKGCNPDSVTFTIVLNACCHEGLVDQGQRIFELMILEFGTNPTLKHFTCLVDLLCRSGQLQKAAALIQNLPLCADAAIWHLLLGAGHSLRDANLVVWAMQRATQSEVIRTSTLVSFSNVGSSADWQKSQSMLQSGRQSQSWTQTGKAWGQDKYNGAVPIFFDEASAYTTGKSSSAKDTFFAE